MKPKFKETLNRKAKFEYTVIRTIEAGIVFKGSEVKSILSGHGSLLGSFAKIIKEEVYVFDFYIPNTLNQNWNKHDENSPKKLLLKKKEILSLKKETELHQNYTLVPMRLYYSEANKLKVELALCFGRNKADKREYIKERDSKREAREFV